jgi:hypothetical protein
MINGTRQPLPAVNSGMIAAFGVHPAVKGL